MGLVARKPVFGGFVNNKGADLISTIVIRLLDSIIFRLAIRKITIFQLLSETNQTGLRVALSLLFLFSPAKVT